MDFMTKATHKLLFFYIIQGTCGLIIHHNKSISAVEGQNISLSCIVGEDDSNINQLEWIKQQNGIDHKIVVFHPQFLTHYFQPGTDLQLINSSKTGKLQGSSLNLFNVKVKDSGNYICELTSFPNGSFRKTTNLQVTGSVMMSYQHGFIKEGDEVKITCSASPPPFYYKLQRSKDKSFMLESPNGEFILRNVTRHNSDQYVCFPEWGSSGQRQGFNSTMELTVNYVDGIQCNTSSPLNVSAGERVVISCNAEASQILQYKWMKGGTIVSLSDTLSLSSVMSNTSGTYKLTAAFKDNQLQTDMEFMIQVLTKTSAVFTTQATPNFTSAYPVFNQTSKHLSNFTSMVTRSWSTGATMTTQESDHFPTSTAKPNVTMTTLETGGASHVTPLNSTALHLSGTSFAPPVGNTSTLHTTTANSTNPSHTDKLITTSRTVFTVVQDKNITTVKTSKDTRHTAYIIIPVLLLLVFTCLLLYKRHLNQKRMDMPPPFKPPPPPVKYTSVRNNDVLMTDILV